MYITILLRIVIPTRIECFIHEINAYRRDCRGLGEAVFLPDNGRGEGGREGGAEKRRPLSPSLSPSLSPT